MPYNPDEKRKWIGNSVSAHQRAGHHPRQREEMKVDRQGRRTYKKGRWVCSCGAVLR